MSIDKILVIIFGLAGIAFTYWFFLMKKEQVVIVTSDLELLTANILVEGGYSPEAISIPKGKTTRITFLRKDASSCLEEVLLPDFKIKKFLPLNQPVTVEVKPEKEGEYGFTCGMNMFHGKIIVS